MNLEEELIIHVNGTEHKISTAELTEDMSLNDFLRSKLHLTGTKRMCLEGGCGVCIAGVERKNNIKRRTSLQAINSCLVPLFFCHQWKIKTIEGIRQSKADYHHLQKVLTHFNGSQCGFCSPGMVMNMYCLAQKRGLTMKEVENSFGGNICRCTGYRSILSAFKTVCDDASPELLAHCSDIEDFQKCNHTCSKPCYNQKSTPSYFKIRKATFIRVFLLHDLLQVLKTFQNSTCYMVAGNTGTGVYKTKREILVYIDITNIHELTCYEINDKGLTVGANLSLTETMDLFDKLSKEAITFSYLKKLNKHLDLVANVPVRNWGTLAGNLMIKYYHNDFPSDIFLILETVGANLIIIDIEGTKTTIPVRDLLTTKMEDKVIEKIIFPPLSSDFKYESYKIMPRAQNAHALVNAGFLLELNSKNIVKSGRIIYGCITPQFIHASKTEEFLLGKQLFDNETLQAALAILSTELDPVEVPPEPSPVFRKEQILSPQNQSGRSLLERSLTTGIQEFSKMKHLFPVSKPMPKLESLVQVSGEAEYIMDMPDLPNQLFGAFVLAKAKPGSIIRKVDTSEALKTAGVVAFFNKDDIPGENNFTPSETNKMMLTIKEEIFCSGKVLYYNQPIGLIVASSQRVAETAADLVVVSYNSGREGKPLITIHDVRNFGGERITLMKEIKANSQGGNVDKVIKGNFELSWQYHYHMETQSCNVVPNENGLDMYPSSQWIDLSQTAAATTLNIPANRINIKIRRLGGAFGAKISRNSLISCAAALAAYKLDKPVKIWLPFETNMNMIGKRYPVVCDYEMGVNSNGFIQYFNSTFFCDYGIGGNEPSIPYVLETFLESYKTDNWNVKAYSTKTDTPANCYIRAPGTCEGFAMVESIMEHAALSLGIDPLEFRIKNLNNEKHELLLRFIQDLSIWADIEHRKSNIKEFNEQNRWKKRGISIVPMVYPFILFASYGVIVSIYKSDGTVSVAHGGVEMGQGINTKAAQVCAYKFGIPIEKITIKPSDNLIAPNAHMVGGSVTSETVCQGVIKACDILLERMKPIKQVFESASWNELVMKCYEQYINLSATAMGNPTEMTNYKVYGGCACEVEVDILTGQHIVKRVDLLEDAGTSVNANIDMGQVEGAFIMGMGYFTSEQIILNAEGRLLTNRTWNYKPPGAKDIPVDFRIRFPESTPNNVGVLNSKAIGEPPLCLACAVPLAIRNAVGSARIQADVNNEKWYPFRGPSTVENTFTNCMNHIKQYVL